MKRNALALLLFAAMPLCAQTPAKPAAPAPAPAASADARPMAIPFAAGTPFDLAGGEIHGSLLLPKRPTPVPVVLIISGSGPTDRDGNSPALPGKNNSLALLADGLASNGIASVRYDKRGIGASAKGAPSEADLRFGTYINDAAAWCKQLKADTRFSKVVIVGHSEGSLIGMEAARQCGAAGFVSIAGAGRRASDILRTQLKGKLPPELEKASEDALQSLEAGKTFKLDGSLGQMGMLYRESVQPYMISWFKYDPTKSIAALNIPILIVQGKSDIQVSTQDAELLAKANPKAKLVEIDGMNHVLKNVPTDDLRKQIQTYGDPSLPVVPELVGAVTALVRSIGK